MSQTFGHRQRGSGPYAELIGNRFRLALKRLALNERNLICGRISFSGRCRSAGSWRCCEGFGGLPLGKRTTAAMYL